MFYKVGTVYGILYKVGNYEQCIGTRISHTFKYPQIVLKTVASPPTYRYIISQTLGSNVVNSKVFTTPSSSYFVSTGVVVAY